MNMSPSPRKAWIETPALTIDNHCSLSPSPRKAWIETGGHYGQPNERQRRLPPGRRGLKPRWRLLARGGLWSPSPRKAWIETCCPGSVPGSTRSPSPRKAWIETEHFSWTGIERRRRLPPGRRGLKRLTRSKRKSGRCRLPPGRRGLKPIQDRRQVYQDIVAFPPEGVD